MTVITARLDAREMNCPLPIIRTKRAISSLESGQVLEITATDTGSLKDMESICQQTGHKLIKSEKVDNGFMFLIAKH